jgi:hypothetical protein
MRIQTLKIATAEGPREVQAQVVRLTLGGGTDAPTHRFMMHDGELSDVRSGYKVGRFVDLIALHYASDPYRKPMRARYAAQLLVNRIVLKCGLEKVQSELGKFPSLNA